jgi:hypothetical protein
MLYPYRKYGKNMDWPAGPDDLYNAFQLALVSKPGWFGTVESFISFKKVVFHPKKLLKILCP